MNDCLFCRIIAGELPSRIIYEDASTIAFLDIQPWGTGHSLVLPKRHVASLLEDSGALAGIAPQVGEVARLLVERLGADGVNVLCNAGAASGQEVMHLHAHVIPRYAASPGIQNMRSHPRDDLDAVHARILGR